MAKAPNLQTLAVVFAEESLARMVEVMRNSDSDATALRAAEHIIKYAFPPTQAPDLADDIAALSPQDRIKALQEALSEELESIEMTPPAGQNGRA
jgi:hypothetical protein